MTSRLFLGMAMTVTLSFSDLVTGHASANAKTEEHWLYTVIPKSRGDAWGLRIIPWALFGNDEDGIFGERSGVPTFGDHTTRTAFRWWKRNPFHNLSWHVLRWPVKEAYILIEMPGQSTFLWRVHRNWVADGPQFQIVLIPFFSSWRGDTWEGYIGWRVHGALGFAFRRA